MSNVIPFPKRIDWAREKYEMNIEAALADRSNHSNYFGDCPHCGETTGYFNIGRDQWCYCDRHQTKWDIGSNVLSSWRHETEEVWQRNLYRFGHYREVEPLNGWGGS